MLKNARYTALLFLAFAGCAHGGGDSVPAVPQTAASAATAVVLDPGASRISASIASRPAYAAATTDGAGSARVKTWAYWGQYNETPVSAAWAAAHMTFFQGDAYHANQFKAAGGTYAVAYTNPFDVIVANHEPLWNLPEAAWLHDSAGHRLYNPTYSPSQNALNPTSAYTQSGFSALTASIAASAPFNFIVVDQAGFRISDALYGYDTESPVEVKTDAQYQSGVIALLNAAHVAPIINGLGGHYSGHTPYLPYVAGGMNGDGCLRSHIPEWLWKSDQDALLPVTQAHRFALCTGRANGGAVLTERTYFLGSWWLTYDPTYSIAFANFASTGNLFVFPEYDIVPTQPLQTPLTSVAELKSTGGAYVRQFAACYQSGAAIGPCAAYVNPTTAAVTLPASVHGYTRSLKVDSNNVYYNGTATWTSGVPSTLPVYGAVIVAGGTTSAPPPPPSNSGSSITVKGTIIAHTASLITVNTWSSCGSAVQVHYSASTPLNGTIAWNSHLTAIGTGSCASGVNATSLSVTP